MYNILIKTLVGFIFVCTTAVNAVRADDSIVPFEGFHSPPEIMKILEESDISYNIGELTDSLKYLSVREKPALNNNYYRETDENGDIYLRDYQVSDSSVELLNAGDMMFASKKYDSALVLYKQALTADSNFFWVLTVIGHAFYYLGEYDSSRYYYEEAIRNNFVDYNAHWFLADLLWKMGDTARTVREITTAHLMNVNHLNIKLRLEDLRVALTSPWQNWSFEPLYHVSDNKNKVNIIVDVDWIPYALVKAVWKYEPGYCKGITGGDYVEGQPYIREEIEALNAWFIFKETSPDKLFYKVDEILEAGYLNSFIYYEMIAPYFPRLLLLLPDKEFNRLIEYLNRFH